MHNSPQSRSRRKMQEIATILEKSSPHYYYKLAEKEIQDYLRSPEASWTSKNVLADTYKSQAKLEDAQHNVKKALESLESLEKKEVAMLWVGKWKRACDPF